MSLGGKQGFKRVSKDAESHTSQPTEILTKHK